jgi:hypothetical protein
MRSYFRPILGGLVAGVIFASLSLLVGAAQAQTKMGSRCSCSRSIPAEEFLLSHPSYPFSLLLPPALYLEARPTALALSRSA